MRFKAYFEMMLQSLHNPRFYQRCFVAGAGLGIRYQLFVLSFIWLFVSVVQAFLLLPAETKLPAEYLRAVAPQFPDLAFEHGALKADIEMPYLIRENGNGEPLLLIDAKGTPAALAASGAPVLLAERSLWLSVEGQALEYELPRQFSGTVTGAMLENLAGKWETLAPYATFIVLPFNILFSFLGSLLRWLILGVAVYVILKSRFPGNDMEKSLRVTAHAMTASMLLGAICYGLQLPFVDVNMLLIGVSFLYLFFAVTSINRMAK